MAAQAFLWREEGSSLWPRPFVNGVQHMVAVLPPCSPLSPPHGGPGTFGREFAAMAPTATLSWWTKDVRQTLCPWAESEALSLAWLQQGCLLHNLEQAGGKGTHSGTCLRHGAPTASHLGPITGVPGARFTTRAKQPVQMPFLGLQASQAYAKLQPWGQLCWFLLRW